MALSVDAVRKIALLARIRLSPEEEEMFVEQLGRIVEFVDQLAEFSSEPPGGERHGLPEAEDRVGSRAENTIFLRNAPSVLDSFFLVPQVKATDDE